MKVVNWTTIILFIIFLLVNIIDSYTATFIEAGEANPLYLLTGNFLLLTIAKYCYVLWIGYILFKNKYPNKFWYFFMLLIMLYGIFAIGMGAYSNIRGMLNPQIVEQAVNIPKDIKISMYTQFVTIIYLLPLTFALLAFKLYQYSLKYTEFGEKK